MNTEYTIGDIVYLKTDPDQLERMVTGIYLRDTGTSYALACGSEESTHYACEMTADKDLEKSF